MLLFVAARNSYIHVCMYLCIALRFLLFDIRLLIPLQSKMANTMTAYYSLHGFVMSNMTKRYSSEYPAQVWSSSSLATSMSLESSSVT